MANVPALSIQDLSVARGERTILAGINLAIRAGETWALLGPNGAGKSTLLKTIAGLLPFSGTIQAMDMDTRTLSPRQRAKTFAYVPQHSALDAPLSAREVVAQGRYAHQGWLGKATKRDGLAVEEALEQAKATPLADRAFSRLSYGERRLVLLARALATHAPILLLDEPTAALDVRNSLEILEVLATLGCSGRAVLVALHQLDEARHIASHALLLRQGQSAHVGPVAEVIAPGPVAEVYAVSLLENAGFGYRKLSGQT